ncbi:hypothetical protein KY348_02950 [Candidatus Woesearchaeota archaeon]|nr:hypothetical protein [Candidatus Woesearchaeota archaeon]
MPLDEIDKEFIEFYQTASRVQGVDASLGTILGVLYLEPEEISMEGLAKKTGYSRASICNKIKMFEPAGFVKRIRKPGTKKVFLRAEKNVLEILKKGFTMKHDLVINLAKEKIPKIVEKYKDKKLTQEQKEKLRIIDNYYKQMLKFEILINEMLKKIDEMK